MNISFSPITYLNNVSSVIKNNVSIPFKGAGSLQQDVFEKRTEECTEKGKQAQERTVTIKDMNGNEIETVIKKTPQKGKILPVSDSKEPVKFEMDLGGSKYYASGYGKKENDSDSFTLFHLFCDEVYNRKYKGAGTELLKSIVQESKDRGLKGRVDTLASNYPPPFVFYYKNNFKATGVDSVYNAAIDYAARNNISVTRLVPDGKSCIGMELDENGADDFLSGKREYLKRSFETIEKREIKGALCEANLIEAPDGLEEDYYIQIINPEKEKNMALYTACLVQKEDENGEKYLEAFNIQDTYAGKNSMAFAQDAINNTAKKLGIKKVVINDENVLFRNRKKNK